MRIGDLLDRDALLYPDAVAVHVIGDGQVSFSELRLPEHREFADATRLRSAGQPVPSVALEIRDESGQRIEPGESGEMFACTDKMMSGYWRNGWLRTGDIGVSDCARLPDGGRPGQGQADQWRRERLSQ